MIVPDTDIPSRPAANERSPNRKDRVRLPVKWWLRDHQQQTFLDAYREAGWTFACAAIQKPHRQIQRWIEHEKEKFNGNSPFLEKIAQVKAQRKLLLRAKDGPLTDKAYEVMDETMVVKNLRLRFDAAHAHLKGVGVYGSKQEIEHTGKLDVVFVIGRGYANQPQIEGKPIGNSDSSPS